jgi:hypothetical protein
MGMILKGGNETGQEITGFVAMGKRHLAHIRKLSHS